ncbi:MAG TPA: ABC transporter permease [Solirubrobacteraceae bacterium]|nr:ABC transporter permease [Solirubrobacteraceae bacterium]
MNGHHRPKPAAFLLVPVAFAIILALFAWPNAEAGPRDLPIGVAGQPAQTRPIEQGLASRGEAFDIHRYADEAAAREAIEDRDIYGAFVATPDGAKVLTATAASAPVATLLTHAADETGAEVEDVTAASARAGALPSSVLPLLIGGILVGVASILFAASPLQRAGLVLGGSLLMGLTATLLIQGWFDILGGDWGANTAAFSLMVTAIAAVVAGLEAVIGKAGIALGALTMVFVGNPFSGAAAGPHMLPEPAGLIGQLMPPGAGANLARSTGYFDGAAAGGHVAVLAAWALLGFALLAVAALRQRRLAPAA